MNEAMVKLCLTGGRGCIVVYMACYNGMTDLVYCYREKRRGELSRRASSSVQRVSELRNSDVQKCNSQRIYYGMGVHLKKIALFFRNPLVPIPNLSACPSSPGAREPISVAIQAVILKKKDERCKKVNVSPGGKR
jgi:hypothetical protein